MTDKQFQSLKLDPSQQLYTITKLCVNHVCIPYYRVIPVLIVGYEKIFDKDSKEVLISVSIKPNEKLDYKEDWEKDIIKGYLSKEYLFKTRKNAEAYLISCRKKATYEKFISHIVNEFESIYQESKKCFEVLKNFVDNEL